LIAEAEPAKEEIPTKETKEEKPSAGKPEEPTPTSSTTSPALQTPNHETKYGSGGGKEAQKAPETSADKPKFFASPLARKIALERGVPLGQVKGTGPDGRITKVSRAKVSCARMQLTDQEDVEKFKGGSSSASATTPTSGATATPGKPAPVAPAEYEDIPASSMRKTIGKRLTESKQQLPHYYLTVEVNMG